ncbi:MAG TPA: hypothetical protein VIL86_02900 [Tepidisphaeraceae bacterium]
MTKRQLIDDIRRFNPTAEPQFLLQFEEGDLKQYLQHLQDAQEKQARIHSWVRKTPKMRIAV